ncbi:peptidyl-tRNA hydrolase II [Agrocybe pediades]|nr:peptidyl-tRNA hydrolase II [Agrocybe pediades]
MVSQAVIGLVVSLSSLGIGYRLGLSIPPQRLRKLAKKDSSSQLPVDEPAIVTEEDLVPEEEDEDGIPDGDLSTISAGLLEPCKMVLVVRTDLKLQSGDIASQCCDATLACYKALSQKNASLVRHWEYTGQAKIALKAKSEDQLLELEAVAKSLNLCARVAFHKNANGEKVRSVLAIGPAPVGLMNEVTGKLRLL